MSDIASIHELYCPQCGYDLRAIESARCPECGLTIDRSNLGESIIPWLHREKLGRYRAFWRTVHLATFQVRKLSRDMSCPARFEDAVKFRRMVALHAWIPLAALIAWFLGANSSSTWKSTDVPGSILQIALFVFWSVCLWLYLLSIGGVASYFFHPQSLSTIRQNRAVALSYYACAPIAYSLLTLGLLCGAIFFLNLMDRNPPLLILGLIWLFVLAPIGIQAASLLRVPLVMLKATTHCDRGRQMALGFFLPVAAVALGFLLLILLPMAATVAALMILSLGR